MPAVIPGNAAPAFAAMPTAAGNPIVERGSNANGQWVRYADGTQACWTEMAVPYSSGAELGATWTFPVAFVVTEGAPAVTANRDTTSNISAGNTQVLQARAYNASATSAAVRVNTVSGAGGSFATTDSLTCWLHAAGRWY